MKLITFSDIYSNDVNKDISEVEIEEVRNVTKILEDSTSLPSNWHSFDSSVRSKILSCDDYPEWLYKFCVSTPGRGVPGSHFLRVSKGREMTDIVKTQKLNMLKIVEEYLIPLKTEEEIKLEGEYEQPYYFVVKSKKEDLIGQSGSEEYVLSLSDSDQLKLGYQVGQLMRISNIGDIGFHNIQFNRIGALVFFDTEPLYGSLLLDEIPNSKRQYDRTEVIKKINLRDGYVDYVPVFAEKCSHLPIFQKGLLR